MSRWSDDYGTNPAYHPEKVGLTLVAAIEYSSGFYEFDTRIVWRRDETGELLTARDSGCSCPTPFDGIGGYEDLEKFDLKKLTREVRKEQSESYNDVNADEAERFIAKINKADREGKQ